MGLSLLDYLPFFISVLGISISLFAYLLSKKSLTLTKKTNASKILVDTKNTIRKGRKVIDFIFEEWNKDSNIDITPEQILESMDERLKNEFCDYYIKNFHDKPMNDINRQLSDEITTYLREINDLWIRIERDELTKNDVIERFKNELTMDEKLLRIYLHAHWSAHKEYEKPIEKRFWKNVPKILDMIA